MRVPFHQAATELGPAKVKQPPNKPQTLGGGGAPRAPDSSVSPTPRGEGQGPRHLSAPHTEIQAFVVLNGWVCARDPRVPRLGRGPGPGGLFAADTPPGWEPDQTLTPVCGAGGTEGAGPSRERCKQGRHRSRPQPSPDRGVWAGPSSLGEKPLSPGQQWRRQDRRGGAALGAEAEHEARPIPARVRLRGARHARTEGGTGSLTAAVRPPSRQGAKGGANLSGHTP